MALSRDKKTEIISELSELFNSSKMTVVAKYEGITVKEIQELRRMAQENGSVIKVVKNRLVIQALKGNDTLKGADTAELNSMLLYVFNAEDEVAGAQTVKTFAKESGAPLDFVGAITAEGSFMNATDVNVLADLPNKEQLVAGVINILMSPVKGVVSATSGKLPAVLQAIQASKS